MSTGKKPREKAVAIEAKNYPTAPSDLDSTAKKAYASVCNDLEKQGTLHKTDSKMIELYARTFSLFRRAEDQLCKEELTLISAQGRTFINPLANVHTNLSARLRQILNDLGLSPRTRLKTDDGEVDERWKDFD